MTYEWENELIRKGDACALLDEYGYSYGALMHEMANLPPADATPAVHAKWCIIASAENLAICSHCGRADVMASGATHCRFCGAEMD